MLERRRGDLRILSRIVPAPQAAGEFGGGVGVTRPPARSTGKFTADDLTVLLARITAHENEVQQPALPEAA
jgi:hypothetical protein